MKLESNAILECTLDYSLKANSIFFECPNLASEYKKSVGRQIGRKQQTGTVKVLQKMHIFG